MNPVFMNPKSLDCDIELIKRVIYETVNTSIPGEIIAFDNKTQTCTVKPCIRRLFVDDGGQKKTFDYPKVFECPVFFPYSTTSGFSMTYPVSPGDQCLIIFSQKSLDNWLRFGSVQDPAESDFSRCLSMNDAIVLVGLIPSPSVIQKFNDQGIEIRNKTRDVYSLVTNDHHIIEAKTKDSFSRYENTISGNIVEECSNNKTQNVIGNKNIHITGNKIEDVASNEEKTISGSFNLSISGSWTVTCPEMSFQGKVKANSFSTEDNNGRERIGVTGAAGPLNTVTFVNGIAVAIS